MSDLVENQYDDADEEQDAHTATYANLAHAAIFRHFSGMPESDDPWRSKVEDVLCDAMLKLEALAWEEVRFRPGMLEVGRAYHEAFMAKHRADMEAFEATMAGGL